MAVCKLLNLRHFPQLCDASKLVITKNSKCMYAYGVVTTPLTVLNAPRIQREVNVKHKVPIAPEDVPQWDMENPFTRPKQSCILCRMNITPDYKNVKLLSQFVSRFTGRVYGRHITRLCKAQQEAVEREIRRAQQAGFMPYYFRDLHFTDDPKLFNPEKPLRPHKY